MKKSILITSGILILSLSLVTAQTGRGYGQGPNRDRGFGQGSKHQMLADKLDLSEEQQADISDLRTMHLKQMTELKNQAREKRARLQTLTTGDNYDQKAVDQVIDELGDIHTNMLKERTAHKQEVRKLLNEEQKIIFDAMQSRRMERGMAHNGCKRGPGIGGEFNRGPGRFN